MTRVSRAIATIGVAALLSVGLASPPAGAATSPRPAAASTHRQLVNIPAVAALRHAVDPSPCGRTLLDDYLDGVIASITEAQFTFLINHQDALFNVPTYDALFFGTVGNPDFALRLHAGELQRTFRDIKGFWSDVKSSDIQLIAMHNESLLSVSRITRTLTAMQAAGVVATTSPAAIQAEAQTVATFMAAQGTFIDNPLWTFNAFAFSGAGDPDPTVAALPDKLVFGDGILTAYDAIGLGDVGGRVIMAHEFGHHIQYEIGTFGRNVPTDPAEATRRTELMADSFAGYYSVHKKGLALNKKRVIDALLSFYTVGDCAFDNPGHHGTPLQRQRATAWGADQASAAKPQSYIQPARTFEKNFDAALAGIVTG